MSPGTGPSICRPETSRKRGSPRTVDVASPERTPSNDSQRDHPHHGGLRGDRRPPAGICGEARVVRPERQSSAPSSACRERPADSRRPCRSLGVEYVAVPRRRSHSVVHARRQAIGIHRSTGATQWRVLRTILADIARNDPYRPVSRFLTVLAYSAERAGWLVFSASVVPRGRRQRSSQRYSSVASRSPCSVPSSQRCRSDGSPVSLLPSGDRTRTPDDESVDERQPSDD